MQQFGEKRKGSVCNSAEISKCTCVHRWPGGPLRLQRQAAAVSMATSSLIARMRGAMFVCVWLNDSSLKGQTGAARCSAVGLPFSSVQLSSIPAFISAPALTAVMGRGRDAAVSSPHQLLLLKQTSRRWIIAALYSLPHQYTPCQPSPVTARLTHLTHSLTHTLVHSRYSHIVTLVHWCLVKLQSYWAALFQIAPTTKWQEEAKLPLRKQGVRHAAARISFPLRVWLFYLSK